MVEREKLLNINIHKYSIGHCKCEVREISLIAEQAMYDVMYLVLSSAKP
jgi:hypothetical protein